LNNLSRLFFLEKKYKESIDLAKESNNYIKTKSLRIRRNNFENIADSYHKLGKDTEAFLQLKKH
jgi:hypothetical protein